MFKSFKSFQSLRYPNLVVSMRSDALIQLQQFFKIFLCFSLDLFSCIIVSHITTIVNPTKCERLIFLLRFTFERLCSRHSWRWVGRRRARELYQTSLQNAENEENKTTRKIEKLIIISSRGARLHPEQKGGKRRKREGRMATDERYQSSHPNRVRIMLHS